MSKLFQHLYVRLYLWRWKGTTLLGKNKRIRLNRAVHIYDRTSIDIHWSLREVFPNGKTGHPTVITDRVGELGIINYIRHIENDRLERTIRHFAEKIGETL